MCPYASTAPQGPDRTDTLVVCPRNTPRRWLAHVSVGVTMRWQGPGRGHASEALDLKQQALRKLAATVHGERCPTSTGKGVSRQGRESLRSLYKEPYESERCQGYSPE